MKRKTSSSPKFLTSIVALRKKYPKSYLGYKERSTLFAPGARVSKVKDSPSCYKVQKGHKYFAFTYKKRGYADFTVIG